MAYANTTTRHKGVGITVDTVRDRLPSVGILKNAETFI